MLLVGEHLVFVEDQFDFIGDVFEAIYARAMFIGRRFAEIDAIFAAREALSSFVEEPSMERNDCAADVRSCGNLISASQG